MNKTFKIIIISITGLFIVGLLADIFFETSDNKSTSSTSSRSSSSSTEKHLKPGYMICTTKYLLNEATEASISNDKMAQNSVMRRGCMITKAIRFSIVERKWTIVKVRIYGSDGSEATGWTYIEAIQ